MTTEGAVAESIQERGCSNTVDARNRGEHSRLRRPARSARPRRLRGPAAHEPGRPGREPAFWRVMAHYDQLNRGPELELKWALILHGIALMTPTQSGDGARSAHDGLTHSGQGSVRRQRESRGAQRFTASLVLAACSTREGQCCALCSSRMFRMLGAKRRHLQLAGDGATHPVAMDYGEWRRQKSPAGVLPAGTIAPIEPRNGKPVNLARSTQTEAFNRWQFPDSYKYTRCTRTPRRF